MSIPNAEIVVEVFGGFYKFSRINVTSGVDQTFLVDQSATKVSVVAPASGAPTASLGSADSNFEKTVTLSGGSSGSVTVVTTHTGTPASSKPSSRA